MTRSFVVQGLSEKYKEVYEIVKQANLKAIEKVKPGVTLSDVDQAARNVIEAAGTESISPIVQATVSESMCMSFQM